MNRRKFVTALPAALLMSSQRAHAAPARLGVIFVVQSTCPYCAAIAPVLAQLRDEGGVEVLLASMDGRPVYPFQAFEDARSHPLTSHYRSVPQVLIYNSARHGITHEISGLRSMRHFVDRLALSLRQSAAL